MKKQKKAKPDGPNHLRNWREYRKLSQEQLAAAIKPPTVASVISLLETGERQLSDKWARRIAPALRIQPGWLLDLDPESLDARALEAWGDVPNDMREQAIKTLESFAAKRA